MVSDVSHGRFAVEVAGLGGPEKEMTEKKCGTGGDEENRGSFVLFCL